MNLDNIEPLEQVIRIEEIKRGLLEVVAKLNELVPGDPMRLVQANQKLGKEVYGKHCADVLFGMTLGRYLLLTEFYSNLAGSLPTTEDIKKWAQNTK